jgi:hypothetical protein
MQVQMVTCEFCGQQGIVRGLRGGSCHVCGAHPGEERPRLADDPRLKGLVIREKDRHGLRKLEKH